MILVKCRNNSLTCLIIKALKICHWMNFAQPTWRHASSNWDQELEQTQNIISSKFVMTAFNFYQYFLILHHFHIHTHIYLYIYYVFWIFICNIKLFYLLVLDCFHNCCLFSCSFWLIIIIPFIWLWFLFAFLSFSLVAIWSPVLFLVLSPAFNPVIIHSKANNLDLLCF